EAAPGSRVGDRLARPLFLANAQTQKFLRRAGRWHAGTHLLYRAVVRQNRLGNPARKPWATGFARPFSNEISVEQRRFEAGVGEREIGADHRRGRGLDGPRGFWEGE